MPNYFYQAMTKAGGAVSGQLMADTSDKAHDILAEQGVAILSLELFDPAVHTVDGLVDFEFSALNDHGQTVGGQIRAQAGYDAYEKLVLDYNLEVLYLVPQLLESAEKEAAKEAGIDDDWKSKIEKAQSKKEKKGGDILKQNQSLTKASEEKQAQELEILQKNLREIVHETKELLGKNLAFLEPVKQREIQGKIDRLDRLRHSNALGHVKTLVQDLIKSLGQEDLFLQEIEQSRADEYMEVKKYFKARSSQWKKSLQSDLFRLQMQIGGVSTEDIKQELSKMSPHVRLYRILLSASEAYLVLWLIFLLVFVGARFWSGPSQLALFLVSQVFWVNGLVIGSFLLGDWFVRRFLAGHKLWIQIVVQVLLVFTAFLLGPVLFFWTV